MKRDASTILLAILVAGVPLSLAGLLHAFKGVPFATMTKDPVAVGGLAVWTGFVSQLGIMLWTAAATVCWMAYRRARQREFAELRPLLLASGAFTLLLAFDDLFLIHEEIAPRNGIPEFAVVGAYAVLLGLYLLAFQHRLRRLPYAVLATALIAFAGSVALDALRWGGPHRHLLEDGLKLVGISCWCAFFVRVSDALGAGPDTA